MPRSARRAQLLEAAQSAFVESGYHGAAMDEIAERAGVSKPVLYQHFPGKLELYRALIDQRASDLERGLRIVLDSTPDNKARVQATVSAYFAFMADDGQAFRLLFENDLINEDTVAARIESMLTSCAQAFADTIAADTGMPHADAMVIGRALTGMAQVAARAAVTGEGDPDRAAALVAQLAWRGLGGFPKLGEDGATATGASGV